MPEQLSKRSQVRADYYQGYSTSELRFIYAHPGNPPKPMSRQMIHEYVQGAPRDPEVELLRGIFPAQWPWERVQECLQLARTGENAREVASVLGVSQRNVQEKIKSLKELGLVNSRKANHNQLSQNPEYLPLSYVLSHLFERKPRNLGPLYDALAGNDFGVYRVINGYNSDAIPMRYYYLPRSEIVELHEFVVDKPWLLSRHLQDYNRDSKEMAERMAFISPSQRGSLFKPEDNSLVQSLLSTYGHYPEAGSK